MDTDSRHHTINTALALDKFLIKVPLLMHIKAKLGGWEPAAGARGLGCDIRPPQGLEI